MKSLIRPKIRKFTFYPPDNFCWNGERTSGGTGRWRTDVVSCVHTSVKVPLLLTLCLSAALCQAHKGSPTVFNNMSALLKWRQMDPRWRRHRCHGNRQKWKGENLSTLWNKGSSRSWDLNLRLFFTLTGKDTRSKQDWPFDLWPNLTLFT